MFYRKEICKIKIHYAEGQIQISVWSIPEQNLVEHTVAQWSQRVT